MSMGHCKTNISKGKNNEFIIPDFKKEVKIESDDLLSQQNQILRTMFQQAQKKKALERKGYYSVRSVAKIMGCDNSALHRWIKGRGIKTVRRVTADSCRQLCSALTKEQVQEIMEKK